MKSRLKNFVSMIPFCFGWADFKLLHPLIHFGSFCDLIWIVRTQNKVRFLQYLSIRHFIYSMVPTVDPQLLCYSKAPQYWANTVQLSCNSANMKIFFVVHGGFLFCVWIANLLEQLSSRCLIILKKQKKKMI